MFATFLRIETLTFGARPNLKWLPAQSVFQSGLVEASSRIYSPAGNETLMALGKQCLSEKAGVTSVPNVLSGCLAYIYSAAALEIDFYYHC